MSGWEMGGEPRSAGSFEMKEQFSAGVEKAKAVL